jgi:hypothetical protein
MINRAKERKAKARAEAKKSSTKDQAAQNTDLVILDNDPTKSSLTYLLGLGSSEAVTEENLDFLENDTLDTFNPLGNDTIDIAAMVDEAINADHLVSPDLKIDDSSCKEAPNVLSWLIDDGFLGCETPYLEQALTCIKLFAQYCPRCSDTHWMELENHEPQEGIGGILANVQMLTFGKCPKCSATRSDLITSGELKFYNELAMLAGQRSGKSIVTAMASTYITHCILKMQKPTDVFKVGKGQILHGTFVALTQGQAKDTLWEPFYGYLQESPWFKKYHALLRFYEKKYGQEFFKLKDTFVLYRHRGLTVYPSGPDGRRLRGRTRIFAAIDEIGWFDNSQGANKVKIGAQGVYEALVRSLATVRSSEERLVEMKYDMAITGYMLNISSPSSIRDKICELVRSSIGSFKTLGVHAPTWKMNPNITRKSGFLLEEYRKDPVTAQRDYGAEPPLTANPFISNPELVQRAFNPNLRNLVKYTPKVLTIGKEKYRYARIDKIKPGERPSIMTIDAGLTANSFALTIGGLNSSGIPTVDLCMEIMPLPGIPLNYSFIYEEVMKPIIRERNVRILCADRWNSVKILQDAEVDFQDVNLIKRQYSLKYQDMWGVKNALEQELLIIPNIEKGFELDKVLEESIENYPYCFEGRPVSHLALQILTVTDTGRSVLKGDGALTDDIWRAMCLLYWATQEEEYIEILNRVENVERKQQALGYALMGSSGGRSIAHSKTGATAALGLTRQRK